MTVNLLEMTSVLEIFRHYKAQDQDGLDNATLVELSRIQLAQNNLSKQQRDAAATAAPADAEAPQQHFGAGAPRAKVQGAGALVPINTDVIPRDVIKMLEMAPKPNRNNWHSWLFDFMNAMEFVDGAVELLFGEKTESWKRKLENSRHLDLRLATLIRAASERKTSDNVSYIIDFERWTSGRDLIDHLRSELTAGDNQARSAVLMDLGRTKMVNNDISKLIREIESLATRGAQLGMVITNREMIAHLMRSTMWTMAYREVWNNLEGDGKTPLWTSAVNRLMSHQKRIESEPFPRAARAAALLIQEESYAEGERAYILSNDEAYLLGKRDPRNPDLPAACYWCKKPGHISKNCPSKARGEPQARLALVDAPRGEVAAVATVTPVDDAATETATPANEY